jgi:hypothetical protein
MMTNHITLYRFCSAVRRKAALALCLTLCVLGLGISAIAQQPTIITFNAPGAVDYGTYAWCINTQGAIVGYYFDTSFVAHGYLRAPDGRITAFEVLGADTTDAYYGTYAFSLNTEGAIAGENWDANQVGYGFVLAPDGRFSTFTAPGAPIGFEYEGTGAGSINDAGTIAGGYQDASYVYHSFVRARDGKITTFDAPGAGTEAYQGTSIWTTGALNPAGAITGYYADANWVYHGFLRAPDGKITTFGAPGAGADPGDGEGTDPLSINANGTITGYLQDTNWLTHGFSRSPDGKFTTFDVPGAGTVVGSWEGTYPVAINPAGAITGYYADASWVYHGFVRAPDGKITTFDAPGAGTESGQGTVPHSINPAGVITGDYIDTSGMMHHGFLRTP